MFLKNINDILVSNEAIAYKGRQSVFSKDLIIFFQQFIDMRNSLISDGVSQKEIGTKILNAFKKKKTDLTDIIKKHTNINYILSIESDYYVPNMATSIKIKPTIFNRGFDRNRSYSPNGKNINVDDTIKKLDSLKSKFDKFNGVIPDSEKNEILNNNNKLYMFPPALFLSSLYHIDAKDLNAAEIAAIVLHECGHVITYAELVNLINNSLSDILEPISINIKSIKDVKKTTSDIRKLIAYGKTNTSMNKKDTVVVENILDSIDNLIDGKKINDSYIAMFLIFMSFVCLIILRIIINIILLGTLFDTIEYMLKTFPSKERKKIGDLKYTNTEICKIEYNCDKYVFMNGLGIPLLTALEKFYINGMLISPYSSISKNKRNSKFHYSMAKLQYFLCNMDYGQEDIFYGTITRRREELFKNITATLRSSDLPKNVEQDLILEFEELKALMKKMEESSEASYNWNSKLSKVLHRFTTVDGILSLFFKNKQDEDYNTIMQAISHLRNSELAYMYKKLEHTV